MSFARSTDQVLAPRQRLAHPDDYPHVRGHAQRGRGAPPAASGPGPGPGPWRAPPASTRAACRQVAANFASGVSCVVVGSCMGWPSPVLDRLTSSSWTWPGITGSGSDGGPLTSDESSWMVSFLDLGIVLGSLPAGWAADRWGRRPVLLGCAALFLAAWLLVLGAQGAAWLYAARLLMGLGSAVSLVVTAMYAAEVSEDRLRGANCTLIATLTNLGVVVSYCVGPYVSYYVFALVLLPLPALFLLCFWPAPESPYWLLMQGRRLEAEQVLRCLRDADGSDAAAFAVAEEADSLEKSILEQSLSAAWTSGSGLGGLLGAARELVLEPGPDRSAFVLIIALVSMQALSGSDAMLAYTAITLPGGLVLDSNQWVIFFGVVSTLAVLVGMLIIDRVGRRPLLLLFAGLQALSLAGSSLYYSLSSRTDWDLSGLSWLTPTALILYGVSYPLGLGSVPNALQMEVFSARVKAVALAAVLVCYNCLTFIVSKTYESVWHSLGKDVPFWFFTVDCTLACLVTAFVLKETKGKSFQEIQEQLDPRRKARRPTWPV